MQKTRTTKKGSVPLIIETHPKDYNGFPFITLIQYRKAPMLVIVDNADENTIRTFVLDLCDPEGVDQEQMFRIAEHWYENNRSKYPISVEFSMRGITPETSKIYRTLNIEFVSRVIGPVPIYQMSTVTSVKRRRRKPIPVGIEISESSVDDIFE